MKSHREIFRASAIIGGSSALNTGIGIIVVKVLAVWLGPAGIGILGIYRNIIGVAATMAGCGLSNSGVRQLAASGGDEEILSAVRRALFLANLLLGLVGMLVLWFARELIADTVFHSAIQANDVGWLGLGVLLTLIASSQSTLLQGLRRIGDLARVSVISALIASVAGITCVYVLGEAGVVWFVILTPAIGAAVAAYFTKNLPRPTVNYDLVQIGIQCQTMIKFGVPVMLGGLMNLATELYVRSFIIRELGIEASGHFQASWMISMTYLGFILAAMSTDYYPRLTAAISSPEKARQLVNEQGEVALLLGGAVILGMITLAPLVIYALYSSAFEAAGDVLRWQMLGDIFKVIAWPMGFVVLASGRSGLFVFHQFFWNAVYISCLYIFVDQIGLLAVGVGFFIAYAIGAVLVWFIANKLIGFVPSRFNMSITVALVAIGGSVIYLSSVSFALSLLVGSLSTALVAIFSLRRINNLIDISGWLKEKFR